MSDLSPSFVERARLGAPKGERNGNYRHGYYTAEPIAERRSVRALIRELAGNDYNTVLSWFMQQQNGPALRPEDRPACTPEYLVTAPAVRSELVRCRFGRSPWKSVVHTITGALEWAIDALSYIRSERMLCRETRVNDILRASDV